MLTKETCRARREALGLLPSKLARLAQVAPTSLKHFEAGRGSPHPTWLAFVDGKLTELEAERGISAGAVQPHPG